MELRPYQLYLIEKARQLMAHKHRKILMLAPCGAGKTVLATFMARNHVERGGKVLFLAHRQELIDQTVDTFRRAGVPLTGVTVMSVQTAARRLNRIETPTMIICDECHHCVAGQWRKVLDHFPEAWVIGLSATPCRLDGRGLGDVFDSMVEGVTTAELIRDGYLAPYRYIAPPGGADLSGIRTVRGDYDQAMIASAVDRPRIIGDAVEHYRRYAEGKQAIVYCANVMHSEHTAEAFRSAGIVAAHIDGKTSRARRDQLIQFFRERRIMVLCNVDLLGEGFDVPACDACVMLRPTQSTALFIQQSMRCMRPAPGKVAIVLDHVGNCDRHGFPDEDREWSLEERKRKPKMARDQAMIICPQCYCAFKPPPFTCPECGERAGEQSPRGQPDEEDGVLLERTEEMRKAAKHKRHAEEAACRSYHDFMVLALARGYKAGWAWHRSKERGYVQ